MSSGGSVIPHLASMLIWAGFSLSPGATEVVFTTGAGRVRTWVGGHLAPLGLTLLSGWYEGLFYLLPIQWTGPICPLVSEATGRTSASILLFFILCNVNFFFFKLSKKPEKKNNVIYLCVSLLFGKFITLKIFSH